MKSVLSSFTDFLLVRYISTGKIQKNPRKQVLTKCYKLVFNIGFQEIIIFLILWHMAYKIHKHNRVTFCQLLLKIRNE
jgi:hypothetical protein